MEQNRKRLRIGQSCFYINLIMLWERLSQYTIILRPTIFYQYNYLMRPDFNGGWSAHAKS